MKYLSGTVKHCLAIIVIITVLYGLSECTAYMLHYIIKGEAFSLSEYNEKRLDIISSIQTGGRAQGRDKGNVQRPELYKRDVDENTRYNEVIHPYLGFVRDPTKRRWLSQYGFPPTLSSMSGRDGRSLNIAILGGSFAKQAGKRKRALSAALRKSPEYSNRNIRIFGLGEGGYKQPQQLFTLLYFLSLGSRFDMVINIDGYNEICLPIMTNIPKNVFPLYPYDWLKRVHDFKETELLSLVGEISYLLDRRMELAQRASDSFFNYSVIFNIYWDYADKKLADEYTRRTLAYQTMELDKTERLSYRATGPSFNLKKEKQIYSFLAEHWKRCSTLINSICNANGMEYFHFLQPNQYVENSKIMGRFERKIAINNRHPRKKCVAGGYPVLQRKAEQLLENRINFHDFTMIFSDIEKPLYEDSCCHLNNEGYDIFWDRVADAIIQYQENGRNPAKSGTSPAPQKDGRE